jgi:uncharacterized RmlC-like cupin family protein
MSANDRPVVTKKGHEHGNTSQSGGLKLMTGVGPQHTPAARIWFGKASNPPGFRSLPHHHGVAETGAYVLSGRARVYFGKDYQDYVDLSEGDFMFVPPFIPHLEVNMSTTDELWWLACRTPENIVVNLPDIADSLLRATAGFEPPGDRAAGRSSATRAPHGRRMRGAMALARSRLARRGDLQ